MTRDVPSGGGAAPGDVPGGGGGDAPGDLPGDVPGGGGDAIIAAGATLRTPAGFVLNNGLTMDNQSPAYITGLGGSERLNNLITLSNQDSLSGVVPRQHWINKAKGVTVWLAATWLSNW